jgi:hypothetical protein
MCNGYGLHLMGSRDGDEAVTEMVRVLGPIANRDWQLQAKSLDWSCWATARTWPRSARPRQAASRSPDYRLTPLDLVVDTATPPGPHQSLPGLSGQPVWSASLPNLALWDQGAGCAGARG